MVNAEQDRTAAKMGRQLAELERVRADAFASLRASASFWVWPADQRPVLPAGTAALHAKAAIADHHTALVTSANLTGPA